ncbi:MAG: hypothetical protein WBV94_29590 [Blastocatellia bacterium]
MNATTSSLRQYFSARCAAALTAETQAEPIHRIDDNPPQRFSVQDRRAYSEYLDWCEMEGREPVYQSLREYVEAV